MLDTENEKEIENRYSTISADLISLAYNHYYHYFEGSTALITTARLRRKYVRDKRQEAGSSCTTSTLVPLLDQGRRESERFSSQKVEE